MSISKDDLYKVTRDGKTVTLDYHISIRGVVEEVLVKLLKEYPNVKLGDEGDDDANV